MQLKIGDKAPEFSLNDQNGELHNLSDYRGRKVVLYFYPKDDTPGCTKEACNFRDNIARFTTAGVEVIGVSVDSEKSHAKFANKYELPFILLADTEKKVVEDYGVWGEKNFMGRKYLGTTRSTFLIDEEGVIFKIYKKVKPSEHAQEILELLGQ
ncbi:MAG: thioredoxin-dependent thiol peroxidase [Anaerolineaceae bacterium]|jgi:peroxiredoxin Q/BCP